MYQILYDEYDEHVRVSSAPPKVLTALQARRAQQARSTSSGFQRIELCRKALEALDTRGWQRSYHQKMFHETFMRACARVFWKTEKPGQFARDHQKILQFNGWDHLSQEILVSTPRRLAQRVPGGTSFPLVSTFGRTGGHGASPGMKTPSSEISFMREHMYCRLSSGHMGT